MARTSALPEGGGSAAFSLRPRTVNFAERWAQLEPHLLDVMNIQPITQKQWNFMFRCDLEALNRYRSELFFSDIYDICVSVPDPLTKELYNAVKTALDQHAQSQYTVRHLLMLDFMTFLRLCRMWSRQGS